MRDAKNACIWFAGTAVALLTAYATVSTTVEDPWYQAILGWGFVGAGALALLTGLAYVFLLAKRHLRPLDILDDLIEIGLDVIQMDQQENMGLALLGDRFSGRITFFSPVDIQNTMAHGSHQEIREYCRKMVHHLGTENGGFIPKWYPDPIGAGHEKQSIDVMCDEFIKIGSKYRSLFRES